MHQVCLYTKEGDFLGYFAGWAGSGKFLLSPTTRNAKGFTNPSGAEELLKVLKEDGYNPSMTYRGRCGPITGKMKVAVFAQFSLPHPMVYTNGWVTPDGIYEYMSCDMGVYKVLNGSCPATIFECAKDALEAVEKLRGSDITTFLLPME